MRKKMNQELNEVESWILVNLSEPYEDIKEKDIVDIIYNDTKYSLNELLLAYKGLKQKGYLDQDSKLTKISITLLHWLNKK